MNDRLSDALASIDINAIADTTTAAKETIAKDKAPEHELEETLKKLTLATPGATDFTEDLAQADSVKHEDNNLPDSYYESTSDELNDDSEREDALVTVAYYRQLKPRRYGRAVARRIIRTIPLKPRKDKEVPLDSAPCVETTLAELEFLNSADWQTLKADPYWHNMEKDKASWKEIEEGMAPIPTTPLMRPFDSLSNGNTVEKASPDMVMDLEDFTPLDVHASVYGVALKVSPSKSPVFRPANVVRAGVDVDVRMENAEGEVEANVSVVIAEVEYEDEGEETDDSIEFILDNQSPLQTVSTTLNGYISRQPPPELQTWRTEYKKKNGGSWRGPRYRQTTNRNSTENATPSGRRGGIAGSNYALANQSNYTLGDSSAYQFLNTSTESLPQTTSNEKAGSASKETHKGVSPRMKDGKLFFPKSQRGKGNKAESSRRRRESSSTFDDLHPFNKGKEAANTPAKTPAKKSPKPQVVVPPNTASGLPEDEVDYDNTTAEESDFSIDVNLEDDGAKDPEVAMTPGPFSPAGPSGVRKSKAVSEGQSQLSPMAPVFTHRREQSWANIVSSPKPVRDSRKLNPKNDPVTAEARNKPAQMPLRETILKNNLEQKGPTTYASIAGAASSPAATMSLSPSPRPMPQQSLSFDDLDESRPAIDINATALRQLGGKIAKRAPPPPPPASVAGPSRLPVPAKKLTGFEQFTVAAVGLPTNPNPWADPPAALPAPRGSVTIGRFPSGAHDTWGGGGGGGKKKKKRTGNSTYEVVDESYAEALPQGKKPRSEVPGAIYVEDEKRMRSEAGESDDGFTTVLRKAGGSVRRGTGRGGTSSSRSASVQPRASGESGAGRLGGGRGMGDIRGRGGAKMPRGPGRPPQREGSPESKPGIGETWKGG